MEVVAAAAALPLQVKAQCRGYGSMEIRWVGRRECGKRLRKSRIPIYISTNPSPHIDASQLRDLFTLCNHSCHRFPKSGHGGGDPVEAVDLGKLRTALSHSSFLVSVFCNLQDALVHDDDESKQHEPAPPPLLGLGDFLQNMVPLPLVSPSDAQLVGFGRAVSDCGLTASIHDVMVLPSLRGMGIGKMIVKRIIRMLTSRDIYDISALCSPNERLFFEACGFGNDMMGSTTMMYTSTGSAYNKEDELVTQAGRRLLVAPPPLKSTR